MKELTFFIFSLILLGLISGSAYAEGNTKFHSFSKAKKTLIRYVYSDQRTTFYCGCQFTADEKVHHSNLYVPKKEWKRVHRSAWQHIVPAHAFGQSFPELRNGHPDCVTKKESPFKGRRVLPGCRPRACLT